MRKTLELCALVLPLALFSPSPVAADPVQVPLTFTVQSSRGPVSDIFGATLSPGSMFTGLFSYDPSAPDTLADPVIGQYPSNGQLSLFTPTVFNVSATSVVYNDAFLYAFAGCQGFTPCDYFDAAASPAIPGFQSNSFFLVSFIAPQTALGSDALPATREEFLAAFSGGLFSLRASQTGTPGGAYTHEVLGFVTTSHAPVPEPASMLLLGTGLAGVGIRRWRQRRA